MHVTCWLQATKRTLISGSALQKDWGSISKHASWWPRQWKRDQKTMSPDWAAAQRYHITCSHVTCYWPKKKKSHIQGCLHGAGKDMILLRERQVTQFTTAPPHPLPQHTHTSALWNWGSVLLWSPKHTGVLLSVLFLVISLSARCQAKCFPSSRSAFNVTLWTPCGY